MTHPIWRRARHFLYMRLLLSAILALLSLTATALYPCGNVWAAPQARTGTGGVVVSAHPLASEAGITVLNEGGNAVDAAIATAIALAVVEPYSSGLGGGGFALVWTPGGDSLNSGGVRALDFRERAPGSAHAEMFGNAAPGGATHARRTGPLSVAIPGLVAGLAELHTAGKGQLAWPALLAPAVRLAREGFEVDELLSRRIEANTERMNAEALVIFAQNGQPARPGTKLVQTALANTLSALAQDGPRSFYEGPIADAIAKTVATGGGLMTLGDLRGYKPMWRTPVKAHFRGFDVYSMPPPSSGGIHLAQMLSFAEKCPIGPAREGSAETIHCLVEGMKRAYADRAVFLGDPDFAAVPVDTLLNPARVQEWWESYDPTKASVVKAPIAARRGAPAESTETTHLSVVDAHGAAVSATLTINLSFGSAWVAEGTGVVLNNEMDDFSADADAPNAFGLVGGEANAVQPYKRPLSSMTPTLVFEKNNLRYVLGAPGGSRIITTVFQVLLALIANKLPPEEAIRAPRIHHQWFPDIVQGERWAFSADTVSLLEAKGHRIEQVAPMCNAQLIAIDPETGTRIGVSDWRGIGAPRVQRPGANTPNQR